MFGTSMETKVSWLPTLIFHSTHHPIEYWVLVQYHNSPTMVSK